MMLASTVVVDLSAHHTVCHIGVGGGGHRIGRGAQDREGLLLGLRGGGGAMQDAARRRRTKQKFATRTRTEHRSGGRSHARLLSALHPDPLA